MSFVSVIVPVLNGERTIRECIVSLLGMDYPPERREILVVDNVSVDRTAEIVKSFPVRYFREERRGASYARNRGIEESKGEILAFTDADCLVTSGWLRELVQGFEDDGIGVVVGEEVTYPSQTPAERYRAMQRPLRQVWGLGYPDSPWFAACSVALRRKVFDHIGLFDPLLPTAEDIDYSWRFFRSSNLKLIYRPKAVVFHQHRVTTWGLFKQYQGYGHGQATLWRKYRMEPSWDWRRELRAYGDLFLTAMALGRTVIPSMLRGWETTRFFYLYCELVRKVGARAGFIRGTFRRGDGYG